MCNHTCFKDTHKDVARQRGFVGIKRGALIKWFKLGYLSMERNPRSSRV